MRAMIRDQRGAIMVVGIFFACMMIGWMWMVVGLGDAMIWRDRSYEAADAVTYSSSAIDAKAMNLISFLNLIMLVLTFIYLIMAFLWNLLDILHTLFGSTDDSGCGQSSADARKNDCTVVATILTVFPYTTAIGNALNQGLCQRWDTIADTLQQIQGRYSGRNSGLAKILGPYEKDVMAALMPVMSTAEDIAAEAAPWAGELLSVYAAYQYEDWQQPRYGMALSATLSSGKLSNTKRWNTNSAESPCGEGEGGNSGCADTSGGCETVESASGCSEDSNSKDYRLGLPVEVTDQGMSDLCYIGMKAMGAGLNNMASGIPVVGQVIGYIINFFAGSFRDTYCEPDSEGFLEGGYHDLVLNFPATGLRFWTWIQDGGTNNSEQCPNNNWGVDNGGGSDGCGGGPDDCRGVYQIKLSSGQDFWHDRDHAGGPHLVVEYAENGNDWMQTYGFVYEGNRPEQAEKLVGLAGMDSTQGGGVFSTDIPQNSESPINFNIYVSQSEFYFDCNGKWSDSACDDDWNAASFQMSWRARLRRVRGLSWGQDLFFKYFSGSLGSALTTVANLVSKFSSLGNVGQTQGNFAQFQSFLMSWQYGAFADLRNYSSQPNGGALNVQSSMTDIIH